jgi:WD40 repeat protein
LADQFCGNTEWEKDDDQAQEHVIDTEQTFMKGHKQAITCLEWSHDNRTIITGSKDCSLIQCKLPLRVIDFDFRGPGIAKEAFL